MSVVFRVNGKSARSNAPSHTPLLWVIREDFKFTGTKFGCGRGLCGACIVHIDGRRALSRQTELSQVAGKSVTTIEGLSRDSSHPLQKAWLAEGVPLLPVRADHERCRLAGAQPEARPRADHRAHEHERLSLRCLSAHRAGD